MSDTQLKSGDDAPSFKLDSAEGEISLSDFKKIILYFYSKDNTSGCTKQAVSFNESYESFKKMKYEIIGISKDTVSSHKKFAEKYGLKFHLLSDPDCKTAEAYGIRKEKMMYGKKVMGTVRSAFIIEEGKIVSALYNIKAESSAESVLEALKINE